MRFALPMMLGFPMLALAAAGVATAQDRPAHPPVEIAPRTPLYCDDGKTIQPFVYGDFGDLVTAYSRVSHMPGRVVEGGKRADGEPYAVVMFEAAADDPRSPNEVVGYALTRHADGWAVRSGYDQPKGEETMKIQGLQLCAFVLKMFLDSDPAHALEFRKRWGEQHPDSTSPK